MWKRVNHRKRRISGLKLSLPSLTINRVKSSCKNFNKNLIFLNIRNINIGVKFQNINPSIFSIHPSLHFRRNRYHFHSIRRSRWSSRLRLHQESSRFCWRRRQECCRISFMVYVLPESEGESERKRWNWRKWRRENGEVRSCGGEWHGLVNALSGVSLFVFLVSTNI